MAEKPPIEIGTNRQLLFDPLFLADSKGVELKMNAPYQDAEPVLTLDRPWEVGRFGRYHTVMLEGDMFRMWYEVQTRADGRARKLLCYAESTDGVHWQKPVLGIISFNGSRENNIVGPPSPNASQQGATVFRDDHGPAEERYKLWTKYMASDEDREQGIDTGLWGDGLPGRASLETAAGGGLPYQAGECGGCAAYVLLG